MQALSAAGAHPVVRATAAGVAVALAALLVEVRGLLAVLDPVAPELAQVGAGALIVFVAATLGGVAGAWQAALAGVRTRRDIVLVGAFCPGAACAAASLVEPVLVRRGWPLDFRAGEAHLPTPLVRASTALRRQLRAEPDLVAAIDQRRH